VAGTLVAGTLVPGTLVAGTPLVAGRPGPVRPAAPPGRTAAGPVLALGISTA
jgi:hypothetical protein